MTDQRPEGTELVGKTLAGRYEIKRLLGRGGMGAVYEAVQQPLGRTVALKVIRRSLCDDEMAVKRFTKEAQAVSQLSHANIVTLFDFGQTDEGVLFLAMEMLEGQSLRAALDQRGPMPWERALEVVTAVCAALVEAHDTGLIHRDLKPDNVMLVKGGREERVKVVDFGIAKLITQDAGQSTLTGTGMVPGTPGYISPEQVNGVSDEPRSDLYALGVLWFELLTGKAPFEGETPMKVVLRHLHDPAPRPSSLCTSSVPHDIDVLVQRLLGKEPAARAADAAALHEELLALGGRVGELTEQVATASLSVADVRALQARAAPAPAPAVATPATAAVAAAVAAPPVKKRRGGLLLMGCLALPVTILAAGIALALMTLAATHSSDDSGRPTPRTVNVNGVPIPQEAAKRLAAEKLGAFVTRAMAGDDDAGIAELAIEGALEMALEGVREIDEVDAQRRALRRFRDGLEDDLAGDELSSEQRRVIERVHRKAKRLEEKLEEKLDGKRAPQAPAPR